jgi:hypothetical protein
MWRTVTCFALLLVSALWAFAQEGALHAPKTVTAGNSFPILTAGQGSATFYLLGVGHVTKRTIQLGQEVIVPASDITISGTYQAIACSSSCSSATFQVLPAAPARLSFLLHPSRVPVSNGDAINATTLVFDRYRNTVLSPAKAEFHITLPDGPTMTRIAQTTRGIIWFQMGSTSKQGRLQIVASIAEVSEPRVIQQVASDACHLRMNAASAGRYVKLETDPIRDCAGNPLPDGTIVSFTKIDNAGRSTVDTPIKKDKASAQFEVSGNARISVACGVALGNELSVGGRP